MSATRRTLLAGTFLLAGSLTLASCAGTEADPASSVDWDSLSHHELVDMAEEEGKVVAYSFTSRIAQIEASFEDKYPGIDLVPNDISSSELIQRLATEHSAGSATADVAYVSDAPVVVTELLGDGVLQNYVPARVADALPERFETPLVSNRQSTKVLMYNEDAHLDGPPVENLWELTEDEWGGRVVMVDPNQRGDYLDLVTEMSLRADDMAAAYEEHTGSPLELDEGVPDAGLQFVKDLYENDAVLVDDTDAVNAAVGAAGQEDPPLGFTSYSDRRDNAEKGWALQVAAGVSPSPGIVFPALLGIPAGAANPAAARLLIDFMMGDDSDTGGAAYEPFYVAGDYPTRDDIAAPDEALSIEELGAWTIDAEATAERRSEVADFLLTIQ